MIKAPRLRDGALCGVLALASSAWLGAYFGSLFGGTAALIACFMLFMAARMAEPTRGEIIGSALLGGFFAAMRVLGYSYDTIDSYGLVLKNMKTLVCGALAMLALTLTAASAMILLLRLVSALGKRALREGEADAKQRKQLFLLSAALIFAGSIPYLMLYAPGLNIYDTHDQLLQFFGFPSYIGDGTYLSDHHPVFLTVLYSCFIKLGLMLGDANIGQLAYSLASMAAISCCFAYGFVTLYDAGLSKKALLTLAACVALYPVLALYAFNMCKDVSVEPFVLLFAAQLIRLETSRGEALKSRKFAAAMFINFLFLMLTRKPSMYALAFAAVFMIIRYKGVRIRLAAVTLGAVVLFQAGYAGLLLPSLGVVPGETREMLSIPFQMTARYLRTYPEDVTQEELQNISRVIDVEHAREHYDPRLSDQVKDTTNPDMTGEDLSAYLKSFISMGLRHPGVYLDAWLNMIYGYFYPSDSNTIVCLTLNSPDRGNMYLRQDESLSGLRLEFHDFIYYTLRRLPGVGALFYVDTVTWAFLFVLLALILRGGFGAALPWAFFVGTLGICMLSPKSGEIRYLMPILYALPVMIGHMLLTDARRGKGAAS